MSISEKYCWRCKKQLDFGDFKEVNQFLTEEKVFEYWNNPYLQYFCCDCYTKVIRRKVKRILSDQAEYEQALKSNFNPTVWRRFAILCYDKGDYLRAEEAYKRVLELDPSDINSAKNLSQLYKNLIKNKRKNEINQ